mmetsp:Transcript_2726/g.9192  ORF Transcript_2726/g.9192 Transcript_2726/m.9192 type:complete len:242 (+) Transcript_2726:1468-2193(+)
MRPLPGRPLLDGVEDDAVPAVLAGILPAACGQRWLHLLRQGLLCRPARSDRLPRLPRGLHHRRSWGRRTLEVPLPARHALPWRELQQLLGGHEVPWRPRGAPAVAGLLCHPPRRRWACLLRLPVRTRCRLPGGSRLLVPLRPGRAGVRRVLAGPLRGQRRGVHGVRHPRPPLAHCCPCYRGPRGRRTPRDGEQPRPAGDLGHDDLRDWRAGRCRSLLRGGGAPRLEGGVVCGGMGVETPLF